MLKGKSSAWFSLGLLMILGFLNYLDRNLLFPAQSLIEKDLGLTKTQLGLLSSGFHIVYAATAPLVGIIADRLRRKLVLLVSVITWSVVTALSGTATGFVSLWLWRSLTGLGEGGYFPTATSLIGDLFDTSHRGRALAMHGVCATLGGSAGYALGGFLSEHLGWRVMFGLAIVPGLCLALVMHRFMEEPPRTTVKKTSEGRDPKQPSDRPSYFSIVLSRPVLLISVAALLAAVSMGGLNSWLPTILTESFHLSTTLSGSLTGLVFGATLLGQLGGGVWSDFISQKPGARPSLVALAYLTTGAALLLMSLGPSVLLLMICYAFTQIGRGLAEPNFYGTILDNVGPNSRGTAQGFLLLMTFAGSSIGPAITGTLLDVSGVPYTFLVLAVFAGLAVVMSLYLVLVQRKGHRNRPDPEPRQAL